MDKILDGKWLILLRSVPGAGKTTFGEIISKLTGSHLFSADDYFEKSGEYIWNPEDLGKAHMECQLNTNGRMTVGDNIIIVANTFTKEKELKPYYKLAEEFGYKVISTIVENRHGGKNVHNVGEETLKRMENNLLNSIKLS